MNRVRELCLRKGIRQNELAKMLGISQPSVSAWFTNKADPSGKHLEKLSEVFGVTRAVILGLDPVQDAPQENKNLAALFSEIFAQLNDQQKKEVMNYMGYLIEERKRKNGQA